MTVVKGYLNSVKERPTKFGTYYTLVVDGKDYDTGSKFPVKGAAVGDYIQFEMKKKDNGYETLVQGSLSKTEAPAGVTPQQAAKAAVVGDHRQEIISKQAALNSALTMAQLLVAAGAIPAGGKNAGQVADKIEAIVLSYRARFYRDATGEEWRGDESDVASAVVGEVDWAKDE